MICHDGVADIEANDQAARCVAFDDAANVECPVEAGGPFGTRESDDGTAREENTESTESATAAAVLISLRAGALAS